jgi:peroxiredoxin Q/BCP
MSPLVLRRNMSCGQHYGMAAFNVVRFRVKPGREEEFLNAHRNVQADWPGLKKVNKARRSAPDFTVDAALGGKEFKFSFAEALKKGPAVLYFYPKSFTSVCTVEAHEFAENIENFAAAGASVIGLSGDKIEAQRDFSTKECRDKFPVGADPSFSVIKAYDAAFNIPVVGAAFANRISYVISPEGRFVSTFC